MLIHLLAAILAALVASPQQFTRVDGLAVDGQTVAVADLPPIQRIAILPDRTTGRDWGLPYLRRAVEDLNRTSPDAVFCIGDMVQGYTRSVEEWERQAEEFKSIIAPLTMPFFPVAGNHDVMGGTRRPDDDTFIAHYRRVFGPLWYTVELDHLTSIILYSEEGLFERRARLSDEQLQWLSGALTAAKARGKPIIVLLHRPLWRIGAVGWSERVQPLLDAAGVKAVFAGHFHSMQRDESVGGVDYHIVGVCGGAIDQHPLSGQFHHLTYIDVRADGTLRVHHSPVGATLPDDWVARDDQDRVYKLRFDRDVLTWKGVFPDPSMASAPIVGEVELEFRNPLDVQVEVSLEQVRAAPGPWIVPNEHFLSWTPVDIFNRATHELIGPFNISGLDRHPVDPGDRTQIPVRLRAIPVSAPVAPPPIEFRVKLLDRRSREIPVFMPLRLPIQRIIPLPDRLESATPYPICVWEPSPYDTLEENPTVRLALERSATADALLVEVRVPDSVVSAYEDDQRTFEERRDDPLADAVRIQIGTTRRSVDVLTEPFAGQTFGDACEAETPERWPNNAGWTQRIRVPWPGGRFDPNASPTLNIGVADNDDTYHTQWRWLSPKSHPARLMLQPSAGRR
ncbi:MAG: metallophosphoesterase [Phycisphaeraceae bacterium]|nr:metallophosphoesterase [Phycisphaeraceae bacterium]